QEHESWTIQQVATVGNDFPVGEVLEPAFRNDSILQTAGENPPALQSYRFGLRVQRFIIRAELRTDLQKHHFRVFMSWLLFATEALKQFQEAKKLLRKTKAISAERELSPEDVLWLSESPRCRRNP